MAENLDNNTIENQEEEVLRLKAGKYIALNKDGKKHKINYREDNVVEFNGKKAIVSVEEDEDGFTYVVYKNRKYPVEIIGKNQNKYQILINNVEYSFSVETPISFRRKKFLQKRQSDQKSEQLMAPMPGKIVEVLVEEGNEIKEGDAVLILEAMKMQNEISAQSNGKVKKVNVKAGDNVMKDDILIEMDK
jgi:biotin carboxyl carrier protein